jgi:hypothetical protein
MKPALILIMLLLLPVGLRAQSIHRCTGPAGQMIFSDQPCTAFNAQPSVPAVAPATAPGATAPVPTLCAATSAALRQAVAEAFALHDANRLAGLVLWQNGGAAQADIRQWAQRVREPLLDAAAGPDDSGDILIRTQSLDGSGASRETRFSVRRQSGCAWLAPPG